MGRKKKPFIDKKKAHTYKLVARSQHDPLYGDSEESQNLLHSSEPGDELDRDTQKKEQMKYGILFDDDYNYLQHLKKPEMVVMEPLFDSRQSDDQKTVELQRVSGGPFGRDIDLEEKMFPTRAPQLDWDPDIVDALKTAEATSDPQEELEDDFVLQANEGESAVPVYVTEMDDDSDSPWWQSRGDFHTAQHSGCSGDEDEESDDEDDDDDEGEMEDDDRPAGLTECSLSSSVVPRSEVLTLLDNRFEKLMEEYDDSNIGNLDEDVDDAMPTDNDQWLIQNAVQDFEKNFTFNPQNLKKAGEGVTLGEIDEDTETEEETELVEVIGEQDQQWDCESILSTYSTLYNHPTKIKDPAGPVRLSKKTDILMEKKNSEPQGSHEQHKVGSKVIIQRSKDESKEDKKTRKKLIKEDRKERRAQKKATKVAFKTEELRMEKVIAAQRNTKPVV